jgi:osmotically-inducible protein OsmY
VTEVDRGLVGLIRNGFVNHPELLATEDNLHIKVDNGLVTLSGWVRSEAERRAIEDQVRAVSGVQGIANQLQVRSN